MSLMAYYKNFFHKLYVLNEVKDLAVTRRVCAVLDQLPPRLISHKEEIPPADRNQHTLLINAPRGPIIGPCPGSRGHLCCNYLTVDLYTGCNLGCSYCIMKHYLNFSPIIVNVDIEATIAEIRRLAAKNTPTPLRIGTGEVGDSLLFDPLFGLSESFIRAFASIENIHFELKTKTDYVEHLLPIENKGQAVIGFSLNPTRIINSEEGSAVSLSRRLAAAQRVAAAGFRVALHFDPIFHYPDWEQDYCELIRRLPALCQEKIAWISLGTFRYLPGLKDKIERRWYLYDEFVPCKDKKYRYLQTQRTMMYSSILARLRERFPGAAIYMCMESPAVWKKVFKENPGKIDDLCAIFKRVTLDRIKLHPKEDRNE